MRSIRIDSGCSSKQIGAMQEWERGGQAGTEEKAYCRRKKSITHRAVKDSFPTPVRILPNPLLAFRPPRSMPEQSPARSTAVTSPSAGLRPCRRWCSARMKLA
jgi:hypothetical protein